MVTLCMAYASWIVPSALIIDSNFCFCLSHILYNPESLGSSYMTSLPSPASSPSLEPSDSNAQPSRKRQRSRSMQSDTSSSSVKRSVSDGAALEAAVRSPSSDQLSSLTLTDPSQEIDSYMAEQGEADIPPFVPTANQDNPSLQSMGPADKVSFVEREKMKKMETGQTWYLVSKRWWKRWKTACTGEIDKDGPPVAEEEVGAVDNTPLLDAAGGLKIGLTEGVDVEFVPVEIWNAFTAWFVSFLFF